MDLHQAVISRIERGLASLTYRQMIAFTVFFFEEGQRLGVVVSAPPLPHAVVLLHARAAVRSSQALLERSRAALVRAAATCAAHQERCDRTAAD
jgi:hypothetical protein